MKDFPGSNDALLWIAGGAVLLVVLFPATIARFFGSTLVNTAGSVATGAVEGIGEAVGVPVTNPAQCQIDLAAGNYGKASFSCDATTWFKAVAAAAKDTLSGGTVATGSGASGFPIAADPAPERSDFDEYIATQPIIL